MSYHFFSEDFDKKEETISEVKLTETTISDVPADVFFTMDELQAAREEGRKEGWSQAHQEGRLIWFQEKKIFHEKIIEKISLIEKKYNAYLMNKLDNRIFIFLSFLMKVIPNFVSEFGIKEMEKFIFSNFKKKNTNIGLFIKANALTGQKIILFLNKCGLYDFNVVEDDTMLNGDFNLTSDWENIDRCVEKTIEDFFEYAKIKN